MVALTSRRCNCSLLPADLVAQHSLLQGGFGADQVLLFEGTCDFVPMLGYETPQTLDIASLLTSRSSVENLDHGAVVPYLNLDHYVRELLGECHRIRRDR
jgi:hypothetical protein